MFFREFLNLLSALLLLSEKASFLFNNNPQGSRLGGRLQAAVGTAYRQMLIHAKLNTGKRGQSSELAGRGPLRRGSSDLECSTI
jgi:hypothetical protein